MQRRHGEAPHTQAAHATARGKRAPVSSMHPAQACTPLHLCRCPRRRSPNTCSHRPPHLAILCLFPLLLSFTPLRPPEHTTQPTCDSRESRTKPLLLSGGEFLPATSAFSSFLSFFLSLRRCSVDDSHFSGSFSKDAAEGVLSPIRCCSRVAAPPLVCCDPTGEAAAVWPCSSCVVYPGVPPELPCAWLCLLLTDPVLEPRLSRSDSIRFRKCSRFFLRTISAFRASVGTLLSALPVPSHSGSVWTSSDLTLDTDADWSPARPKICLIARSMICQLVLTVGDTHPVC